MPGLSVLWTEFPFALSETEALCIVQDLFSGHRRKQLISSSEIDVAEIEALFIFEADNVAPPLPLLCEDDYNIFAFWLLNNQLLLMAR